MAQTHVDPAVGMDELPCTHHIMQFVRHTMSRQRALTGVAWFESSLGCSLVTARPRLETRDLLLSAKTGPKVAALLLLVLLLASASALAPRIVQVIDVHLLNALLKHCCARRSPVHHPGRRSFAWGSCIRAGLACSSPCMGQRSPGPPILCRWYQQVKWGNWVTDIVAGA